MVRILQSVNSGKIRDRLLAAALLGTLVLVPLLVLPGVLLYFDVTPKVAVLLLGTSAVLLLGRVRRAVGRDAGWFRSLLLVQGASLGVATLFSTNPLLSVTGSNWRRYGLVVQGGVLVFAWLAARYLTSLPGPPTQRLAPMLRTIALTGSAAALYGVAQYLGWDPWLPVQAYHTGEDIWTIVRPPGTLGHAGYLAAYLIFVVCSAGGLALLERGRGWRTAGLGVVVIASAAIALSGSRGGLLGLAVAGVTFLFWTRPRVRPGPAIAVLLALAAVSTAFYASPAGQRLRSRVHWSKEDALGGARLYLWRDTLRLVAPHWLAGTGPETFTANFAKVQSTELARAYPDFHHESPHNMFLDALASQGVAGPVVLLLLCVLGFRSARRARSLQPGLSGTLVAALTGSLVAQQFQSFVAPTALFFFVNLAMLVGLEPAASGPPPGGRITRLPAATACAVVALLLTAFAVRLVASDRSLALITTYLDRRDLQRATTEHSKLLRWQPPGADFDLWYSRSLLVYAQSHERSLTGLEVYREALDAAIRASRCSEAPHNAYYSLAAAFAIWNDLPRTISSLRLAIAASPTWYKPHWVLANVLRRSGRLEEAKAEAELADHLSGGKHGEVTEDRIEIARLLSHK